MSTETSRLEGGLYGSEASPAVQRSGLRSGEVPVAVFGLGKMGLPIAAVFAELTGNVVGVDVDPDIVAATRAGTCHVSGEPGLADLVAEAVEADALDATTDGASAAERARIAILVVPTLVEDGTPDLTALDAAVADVADGLEAGDTVFVESTLPPGTCMERIRPRLTESGVDPGAFGLAVCPERTASGRALQDVRGAYPKVVGGVDSESTRVAELVYDELVDNQVVPVSDATTAECVKVFEGVYRDVNIGLANELARHAVELDVDVSEAITAANSQPFCDIHDPGVGVGGHCIPYYPQFLQAVLEEDLPVVRAGRESNERMPQYTAEHVLDGLRAEGVDPSAARTLVLGLTYRPGIDEIRATPAHPLISALTAAGVSVDAVDPVASTTTPFEEAGATVRDLEAVDTASNPGAAPSSAPAGSQSDGYDAAVLVTCQRAFDSISIPDLRRCADRRLVLVDGRQEFTHLRDHDSIHYRGIGIDA